jgi:hypothetical protein
VGVVDPDDTVTLTLLQFSLGTCPYAPQLPCTLKPLYVAAGIEPQLNSVSFTELPLFVKYHFSLVQLLFGVLPLEHTLLWSFKDIVGFDVALVFKLQLLILGAYLTSKVPQFASLLLPPQFAVALMV